MSLKAIHSEAQTSNFVFHGRKNTGSERHDTNENIFICWLTLLLTKPMHHSFSLTLTNTHTHTQRERETSNLSVPLLSLTLLQRGWSPFLHQICSIKVAHPLFFHSVLLFYSLTHLHFTLWCDMMNVWFQSQTLGVEVLPKKSAQICATLILNWELRRLSSPKGCYCKGNWGKEILIMQK